MIKRVEGVESGAGVRRCAEVEAASYLRLSKRRGAVRLDGAGAREREGGRSTRQQSSKSSEGEHTSRGQNLLKIYIALQNLVSTIYAPSTTLPLLLLRRNTAARDQREVSSLRRFNVLRRTTRLTSSKPRNMPPQLSFHDTTSTRPVSYAPSVAEPALPALPSFAAPFASHKSLQIPRTFKPVCRMSCSNSVDCCIRPSEANLIDWNVDPRALSAKRRRTQTVVNALVQLGVADSNTHYNQSV